MRKGWEKRGEKSREQKRGSTFSIFYYYFCRNPSQYLFSLRASRWCIMIQLQKAERERERERPKSNGSSISGGINPDTMIIIIIHLSAIRSGQFTVRSAFSHFLIWISLPFSILMLYSRIPPADEILKWNHNSFSTDDHPLIWMKQKQSSTFDYKLNDVNWKKPLSCHDVSLCQKR